MKKKSIKTVISALLVICMLVTCMLTLCGCDNELGAAKEAFCENWMRYVKDETPIKDIVIPGSHDAGTKGMLWLAQTQNTDVEEQLESGVRYLDIRVEKKKNGKLVIFHGPIMGMQFSEVLDDIEDFIEEHPTETLILDFQHFNNGSENDVANLIELVLGRYLVKNETAQTDLDYVDGLTLAQCRGKVIITWGSDTASSRNWAFRRNNDECTLENVCLNSMYLGEQHKQGSEHLISTALPQYIANYAAKDKGIFVLQGQLTAPKLLNSPKGQENKHSENMTEYVKKLAENSQVLPYINIIMRDYIVTKDMDKIDSILHLNVAKNNVLDAHKDLFADMTE